MNIPFYKYQGTGNDFVLIDNRHLIIPSSDTKLIAQLCDRHFGIGADGVILLETSEKHDFYMRYFNADGKEGTMCGNGGRCVVAFAHKLGIIENETQFDAIDGLHKANISQDMVNLQLSDVQEVTLFSSHSFLDTGSPHHVTLVENVSDFPVYNQGKKIRYEAPYYSKGSNVNFVEQVSEDTFKMRTYERGVEDETLSCGTGATAVALAMYAQKKTTKKTVYLDTLGGELIVSFIATDKGFSSIYLKGKATCVFEGTIAI